MITAIVLIHADVNQIPEVASAVADVPNVSEVYSVTGDVDLIAMVRVREYEDLAETISGRINKVPGVSATDTHLAFRAYSSRDLDEGFDLGVND